MDDIIFSPNILLIRDFANYYDFYKKLKTDPLRLEILGNGKQRKSYLYVQDCIDAIFVAIEKAGQRVNINNLGQSEYCEVNFSVGVILHIPSFSF